MDQAQLVDMLVRILAGRRFNLTEEKICQEEMGAHLKQHGIPFEREVRLCDGIVDFLLTRSGIAIEVKVGKKWSKMEVFRQCERYCLDSKVTGLVLASGRAQGLPDRINNKPARVLHMGVAYL